MLTKNVRRFL